jgi:hypothetical protein
MDRGARPFVSRWSCGGTGPGRLGGLTGLADRADPPVVQVADLTIDQRPAVELAGDPLPQPRRHRRAVELPQPLQPLRQPRVDGDRQPQPGQQPLTDATAGILAKTVGRRDRGRGIVRGGKMTRRRLGQPATRPRTILHFSAARFGPTNAWH